MNNTAKKPGNPFVLTFLFLGFGLFSLITGIMGCFSNTENINDAFDIGIVKGNSYEGEVKYCSQCVCEYSHRLNFIIPLGTEYYYIAFSEDQSKAVVVRAGKNFGDNFDEDTGKALSTIQVKGKVRKIPSKIQSHFNELKLKLLFSSSHASFDTSYIDFLSGRIYTIRLISGIGILISDIILTLFIIKSKSKYKELVFSDYSKPDKILNVIGCIILIISMLLFAYSIIML